MNTGDQMDAKLLELPTAERARLARMLLLSLEPQVDEEIERVWIEEAERRLAEVRRGEVQVLDGRKVMEEARKAIQ